uniref:Ionotropic glutamate receptor L-glutamate and glycine-binding domain-containing protein n=1 Tax=Plectus sambesii TaxID=2011161 RepID=A0A914V176_9BILA
HGVNRNYVESDLRGKTLRVLVPMLEPPYVNYMNITTEAETSKGYGPGVVMEILREIGSKLNLSYDLVLADTEEWGSVVNGNWTGAFASLLQGEADILAGAAIMQYERSLVTDLTYPFQFSETGMMIRSPEKYFDNTLLIVTEPFKWEVWGLTAVSIVISGLILKAFTKSLCNASEIQYTWFEAIWVFFSVFVQQGLPVQPKSWTCRTMLAFWWLASLTLIATFTGSLVALFAVDKTNMPFETLEQMVRQVQRGQYRVVMDQNSQSRTQMIARSDIQTYKDLWHEMKINNRSVFVDGLESGVRYVKQNKGSVLLGPMDALQTLSFIDCDVVVLSQGILPTYM